MTKEEQERALGMRAAPICERCHAAGHTADDQDTCGAVAKSAQNAGLDFDIRIAGHLGMATKLPEFVRDPETGEILRDANGEPRRIQGAVVRLTSPD